MANCRLANPSEGDAGKYRPPFRNTFSRQVVSNLVFERDRKPITLDNVEAQ
ncbi:hypothetical protein [Pseudomonas corrugata]|uniref:hypothetical protein n=1 Tax=Pseudomonas corrugata TaxID=47879 RepID=UPI001586CAAE|nr:hypothetical protein [Pseudomonas corrugata]MCI0993427.1 hypothetical protein [Pseudomonas corrugata]NUT65308.1 hypothetical protein [Pseudomonas corrugata]